MMRQSLRLTDVYEVRPRKDKRGVDLISDVLPFGRLCYGKPDDAIEYAKHCSRSHDAVIRVYNDAGDLVETHKHAAEFKSANFVIHTATTECYERSQ